MIYHVTFTDWHDWSDVHDFYFTTKKEAVAFIKGLPYTENAWSPEVQVTLTKVKLPKSQKDWAWTLTHLVLTANGVYQGVIWHGREVFAQEWTYEDGKWSVLEVNCDD